MDWRRPGDKPLSEQWCLVYWRIYASLGLTMAAQMTTFGPVNGDNFFKMTASPFP